MKNPFVGHMCVVRTRNAGVHIGIVHAAEGTECHLTEALRLWSWKGAFTLSAVASAGITGGRVARTGEIFLPEAIEFIPVSMTAAETYERFV